MKLGNFTYGNWVLVAAMLAASGPLLTSCSKDRDVEIVDKFEGTKLVISVAGINEGQVISGGKATSKGAMGTPKVKSYGEFDAQTVLDSNVPVRAGSLGAMVSSGISKKAATGTKAATIANGVKYRVFLFTADGGTLVTSAEFTSGTAGTIDVTKGTTYKWVAVSYNNGESVPSTASFAIPGGKDVLYASGTTTIPTGAGTVNVPIGITFAHKFSRIAIELNSMGMFGNMQSPTTVAISGLSLQTGTLNVVDGTVGGLTSYAQTINFDSFTDVDPLYQDDKIVYAYTAGTTAMNVNVGVSNLTINHVDGDIGTGSGDGIRRFSAAVVNFPFSVTPQSGNSHRLLINLVESPLTYSYNGSASVRWARTNLYYQAGHNSYRFYGANKQRNDINGYFSFNGHIPMKYAQSVNPIDPCTQVYPQNVWRSPKNTEFNVFTTDQGLLTNILGSVTGIIAADPAPNATTGPASDYVEYNGAIGSNINAFGVGSNALRFYYNGVHVGVNLLGDGILTLNLGNTYGREATLWSSDKQLNLLGLAGVGAWGYHAARRTALLGGNYIKAQKTAELLSNIDILGINLLTSTLKNVRCVRN